jgi:transcriptional regulator with XRE-family HTH domain
MDLDPLFKDRIKWAITAKDSNQSELARNIKVSAQGIQQWVSGATTNPRRDHLLKAAEWLGVRFEWLAYGRGPMTQSEAAEAGPAPGANTTEDTLLAREWERALLAALPEAARANWRTRLAHPGAHGSLHVDWNTPLVLAEIGLYRHVDTLVPKGRKRLWLLALAAALTPAAPGRRVVLLLAPLESWRDTPARHIAALRAEARTLGLDVIHVQTPDQAAALLMDQAVSPDPETGNEDIGLDMSALL